MITWKAPMKLENVHASQKEADSLSGSDTPPPTPPPPAAADYPEAIHVYREKTAAKLEIWCDVVSIL